MELISHHQQGEFRKGQKMTPHVQPPPRIFLDASILAEQGMDLFTRKDSESEWLVKDNLETNPIIVKPNLKPCGRAVLLGSLTFLLSTRAPLPNRLSCFVGICVSLDSSFPSVRREPTFRPWKGSPSCNNTFAHSRTNIYCVHPLASPFWKHSI